MTEAKSYSKFGFDNQFFELDVAGGFNNNQARADALEQARAEGFAAGVQEGKNAAGAEVTELTHRLTALTDQLTQAQKAWEERSVRQLLVLWHGSFSRLLGQAVQHYPEPILEQHLKSLLPLIGTSEELTLRINPGARHFHEKLGLAHAHISGHNFRIVDDHSLPVTDCVVEWRSGGLEARVHEHEKLIADLLVQAGANVQAPPPHEPGTTPAPAAAAPAPDATAAAKSRASALLGDDELVEALK
ncbi:MAG TPA: FliH/SctL family protein [Alphaproteobacteria bacterium]|nr:FliH/SctL family protein [Alphaproteobacteria bacterium]